MMGALPQNLVAMSAIVTDKRYHKHWSQYEVLHGEDKELQVDCIAADTRDAFCCCLMAIPGKDMIMPNREGTGPAVLVKPGNVIIQRTSRPLTERFSPAFLKIYGPQWKLGLPS